jgi:hypothetical protein
VIAYSQCILRNAADFIGDIISGLLVTLVFETIMNKISRLPCVIFLPLILAHMSGCSKDGTAGVPEALNSAAEPGASSAAQSLYSPPADGKLTQRQVDIYMKVKNRELEMLTKEIRHPDNTARADSGAAPLFERQQRGMVGRLGYFVGTDVLAAADLGVASDEFEWIKDTVIDTSSRLLLGELHDVNRALVAKLQDAVQHYEKNLFNATNPQEKESLKEHVNDLKSQISAIQDEAAQKSQFTDAMRFNMQLLQSQMAQLKTLDTQINAARR